MRKMLLILMSMIILGAGCRTPETVEVPVPIESPVEQVDELTVVIDAIDLENQFITVTSVDGEQVRASVGETQAITEEDIGSLLVISGERDRTSRQITIESFRKLDTTDVVVITPLEMATVTSPLLVTGFTRTGAFRWELLEEDQVVSTSPVSFVLDREDAYQPFSLEIFLPVIKTPTMTVRIGEVTRELQLLSTRPQTFTVVFHNRSCTEFFEQERQIAQTAAISRAALLELLAGPTADEKQGSIVTSIPENTFISAFSLQNRQATVTLGSDAVFRPGTCGRFGIERQIRETLAKFEEIDTVEVIFP